MKLAMLCRWNTSCGVSLHAELIGRQWVKEGHKLSIFAPENIRPVAEDEDYVLRISSDKGKGGHEEEFFKSSPFVKTDYEVFVGQRIGWIPLKPLLKVFPKIKKKAPTVYVVHERETPKDPLFYEFEWEAIVCFDERYKAQWVKKFPPELIHIIPYPTGYLRPGNKQKAREKLGLPLNERLIFSYGWAPQLHIFPIIPALEELSKSYQFKFLVFADPKHTEAEIESLKRYKFVQLQYEAPTRDEIYTYLHASDACLMHKEKDEIRPGEAAVPSAILMCLGALTPVITSDTDFIWFLDKAVMKYSNKDELIKLLIKTFEGDKIVNDTLKGTKEYVTANSPEKVGGEFIKLFNQL